MLSAHVPDLRGLELLVLVARTGSLTSAATELGISQQAASSRIRTMESLIGSPLLTRTTKGSVLTQHGDLVVQWAKGVMDAAEQLDAGLAALKQDRMAHLSIAASLTIAEHLLPSWLVAVRSRQVALDQPPTDFTMTATNSERVAGLVRGGLVDLGFVEGPEPPQGLRHRLIAVDSLVVVVGRSHPWAARSGRRVTAAALAAAPLVVREEGSGTRTVLERALASRSMAPPVLELSSTAAVCAAVAEGAGPAALSSHAVRNDVASGRLVRIAVSGLDLSRRLHAVWTGGPQPARGPARELVDFAVHSQATG